jgi:SAM-dependent methyltransferase
LVVLFQVLEHMTDPVDMLRQCARVLKRGGTLIVAVPNAESWQARFFGANWVHLDVPRQLFHFTLDSLTTALREHELRVSGVRYESFEHDPFGWLQGFFNVVGFKQNLLIKTLQGLAGAEATLPKTVAMAALAMPLGVVSVGLSLGSWAARKGALMEVWSIKE